MRAVVYRGVERVEVADVPDPVIEDPGRLLQELVSRHKV